jgi:calcineurin-like phosphoesterase family protein
MKYWIIADTHFNHDGVTEYCNRPSNWQRKTVNALMRIPKEDVLIHLGDVEWGNTHIMDLVCSKRILVLGNHDKKSKTYYQNKWDFVCNGLRLEIYGKKILFTHKPVVWDGWYDINIHGHFHNIALSRCFECEPELKDVYNNRHRRLSLELEDYKPVRLEKFIYRKDK